MMFENLMDSVSYKKLLRTLAVAVRELTETDLEVKTC